MTTKTNIMEITKTELIITEKGDDNFGKLILTTEEGKKYEANLHTIHEVK